MVFTLVVRSTVAALVNVAVDTQAHLRGQIPKVNGINDHVHHVLELEVRLLAPF